MEKTGKTTITVEAIINVPKAKVWEFWTSPSDIEQWNNASDDWHTPKAYNDLRAGGKFLFRMEARNGSFGFDFAGIYDEVVLNQKNAYTSGDGRKVEVNFSGQGNATKIVETFEAESVNPIDMQRSGWQAILNNFKKYTESN